VKEASVEPMEVASVEPVLEAPVEPVQEIKIEEPVPKKVKEPKQKKVKEPKPVKVEEPMDVEIEEPEPVRVAEPIRIEAPVEKPKKREAEAKPQVSAPKVKKPKEKSEVKKTEKKKPPPPDPELIKQSIKIEKSKLKSKNKSEAVSTMMSAETKAAGIPPKGTPRNYVLAKCGVMRFSQSRMYKKRGLYAMKNRKYPAKEANKSKTRIVEKEIKGDKNGEKRLVRASRMTKYYPTEDTPRKRFSNKKCFKDHKHKLRSSITPGTVLILLAGVHKGKRVVFLKQLASGLLLVTGPFYINGCPLRRINQIYVIGTKTKLDISGVKLPENLNDDYFKRMKFKKSKNAEGDIFDTKKESYSVTEERKKDQIEVDTQILTAIKNNPEKKLLTGYLGAMFSLKNHQYPNKMLLKK
jgi:large subunit ribosomal protein L6e